jgi:hypothetical protein
MDAGGDRHSRLQDYQERIEQLMASAREGVERQAPDVLEKGAATARSIAERLDNMARDVRQKRAGKDSAPASGETAERPSASVDEPPTSARGSGAAPA